MLQLALLVGGLFVLGLLCGERSHAADGAASAPVVIPPVTGGVHDIVRPVTEQVVRPVTERTEQVVRPVGDLADQIAAGITGQPVPPPVLPVLPTLPPLPALPEVPARTLPAGTAEPQQPGGAAAVHQAAGERTARKQPARKQPGGTREAGSRPAGKPSRGAGGAVVFGPRSAGGPGAAGDAVRDHAYAHTHTQTSAVARIAQAPVHRVPDGDPSGALRNRSAVDGGSPRHGDPQAVTPNEGIRPTSVPAIAADPATSATRDRHRDIPASPG
ncbi:hypothetical protein [Streptomyces sp. V3I8]|uniref:hypothetical protein n=1 Tax=Streptomyces sp. V3I8 TaxID=3042279 RepID=UPI0027D85D48|nr:hypothetical protein [Streptomyces sp. V3I8]